ncbi:growth-regulating factor 2-like [Hordeum vulgare subsp. vulgare]|uniref:Growth-regulating factor n=1 Tax=Hordeum vulgare subsp. vulgare TaxID=112509 RepID=A0A8I6Y4Z9_HORVV|nr:growth-regulating factor 2-like [Hordeum vulgare subsp. vulgare]KAI4976354.1 hypothetical protein ZWY2020_049961 [Hordeum vulgare]
MMLGGQGGGGRCLFTASQWRELEHQALIYKYMAAGSQVPHELVVPLRHRDAAFASIDTAPSLACFPPPQPSLGWGLYGTGAQYARKPEDPEPGRCRRTDGKKWRCSREAYGESKYCDRHMHRGKNRSRKPVEPMSSSSSSVSSPAASYRQTTLSMSPPTPADAPSYGHGHGQDHLRAAAAQSQINPLQLHLDTRSPPPSYHRYAPAQQYGGSYFTGRQQEAEAEARRRQHFLALGADLSLDKPDATAAASSTTEDKPLRRFFDEWPRDGNAVEGRPWNMGHRDETQLSMSIPTTTASHPDLAAYRRRNDE